MRLPVDIRDEILTYLLSPDNPIIFEFPAEQGSLFFLRRNILPTDQISRHHLAIIRVNLQLYQEYFRLLYHYRYFRFNIFYTSGCYTALHIFQAFPLDRIKTADINIKLIYLNA